jgi:formylmethanofuran dehydrogenase subunit A
MVSNKELEARVDSIEETLSMSHENTEKSIEDLRKMMETVVASVASLKNGRLDTDTDSTNGSPETSSSAIERAHIQFPSFDGTNFRDWHAPAEQFFKLDATPED